MTHVNNNRAWRSNQAIRQALFELEEVDIKFSDGNGAAGGIDAWRKLRAAVEAHPIAQYALRGEPWKGDYPHS